MKATDETVPESSTTETGAAEPTSAGVHDDSTVASAISSAAEISTQTAANAADVPGDAPAAPSAIENPFTSLQDDDAPAGLRTPGSSSAQIAPTTTLYVGNLFFESTEAALRREFSKFGEISNIKIIYDHRGLSKGYGYEFKLFYCGERSSC